MSGKKIVDGLNEAVGAETERARIVAWLRHQAALFSAAADDPAAPFRSLSRSSALDYAHAADRIEQGEHL